MHERDNCQLASFVQPLQTLRIVATEESNVDDHRSAFGRLVGNTFVSMETANTAQ